MDNHKKSAKVCLCTGLISPPFPVIILTSAKQTELLSTVALFHQPMYTDLENMEC